MCAVCLARRRARVRINARQCEHTDAGLVRNVMVVRHHAPIPVVNHNVVKIQLCCEVIPAVFVQFPPPSRHDGVLVFAFFPCFGQITIECTFPCFIAVLVWGEHGEQTLSRADWRVLNRRVLTERKPLDQRLDPQPPAPGHTDLLGCEESGGAESHLRGGRSTVRSP